MNRLQPRIPTASALGVCQVITCHDADGQLLKLLQAVRDTGNCGHSFDIVVDPDAEKKTTISWDGDGSDRISSITSNNAELDLRKVLLANINTMRYIARPAIPDPDEPDKKLDDPIEALKKIEYTCDALLDGNSIDFGNGIKEMLDCFINNAKDYIKACDAVPKEWDQNWTPKEGFEHMLWCFNHYYERMVKSQEIEMPEEDKDSATSDGTTMDTATTDDATAKQKADILSVLPKSLTRQKPIRSEIDANREMATAAQ